MCELLGMSANVPTDICFSFAGLMQRGGGTGPHKDGWGIGFYEDRGLQIFQDSQASVDSPLAELISQYPRKSKTVISHIRQANVGEVKLANTHPFTRELWGYAWTFAHNGQLDLSLFNWPLKHYFPVGSTDSEYAFCWIMDQIRDRFPQRPENFEPVVEFVAECADKLHALGVFNMLLTESEYLLSHCSTKLHWITRRAPFGLAQLKDAERTIDFCRETQDKDIVTVIATEPLTTNEVWNSLEPGSFCGFQFGELCFQR